MSERNNKLELLGSAPIPKALMALGIPIMIGMLINALYNLVDAYFVSGLGKSQMGAISVVFPLGQVVVGLGLMFGNGAASYLSRLLGRGDKDTADKVASTALYSSILIGAIIILLSTIFLKPILVMLGATETIMPYAWTYARIYVLSCIHKQLAKVKPEKREQFEQRHSRELILYDAAVRYLKDLKDSGEGITPKAWQREIDQLAAGKQTDTLAMKSMREELKAVERLRKTAEQLSQQERNKSHDREPER